MYERREGRDVFTQTIEGECGQCVKHQNEIRILRNKIITMKQSLSQKQTAISQLRSRMYNSKIHRCFLVKMGNSFLIGILARGGGGKINNGWPSMVKITNT